jgi:hypothetical protein
MITINVIWKYYDGFTSESRSSPKQNCVYGWYSHGLQSGGHVFWDCKLCTDQRATNMDILSEKKNTQSVLQLLRLEEKRFVHGVCYFINKVPKNYI